MKLKKLETWVYIGLLALGVAMTAVWQYLKFRDSHGIYYRLNPQHGDLVLFAVHGALLVVLVCVLVFVETDH